MNRSDSSTATRWMALALAPVLFGCSAQGDDPGGDDFLVAAAPAGTAMLPTSDGWKYHVVGVGNATALYKDVDDGSDYTQANDSTDYVRGEAGIANTAYTAGYSAGP